MSSFFPSPSLPSPLERAHTVPGLPSFPTQDDDDQEDGSEEDLKPKKVAPKKKIEPNFKKTQVKEVEKKKPAAKVRPLPSLLPSHLWEEIGWR